MSGITIKDTRSYREKYYVPFGKFIINMAQLDKNNIILIKYPKSFAPCPSLLRTVVSDKFKELIIDLVDTAVINIDLQKQLQGHEIDLFEKLLKKSAIAEQLNYSRIETTTEDYKTRLRLLQASMNAGNRSIELLDESKDLLQKLNASNDISDSDYEMLLSCLDL